MRTERLQCSLCGRALFKFKKVVGLGRLAVLGGFQCRVSSLVMGCQQKTTVGTKHAQLGQFTTEQASAGVSSHTILNGTLLLF